MTSRLLNDANMTLDDQNTIAVVSLVLIQDEHPISFFDLFGAFDPINLTSLHIVDCTLRTDEISDAFSSLRLRSLVLSKTSLRGIPAEIYQMVTLMVLKLDHNSLDEVSSSIGNLVKLEVFCVQRQRPRLRSLPDTLRKLEELRVVNVSANSLEDVSFVTSLKQLRDFRCSDNCLRQLPEGMGELTSLVVLDVSQNLLEEIAPSLAGILPGLYRFMYFNRGLRPRYVMGDMERLVVHLDLQRRLMEQSLIEQGSSTQVWSSPSPNKDNNSLKYLIVSNK